jgi:hypothetical protein
MANRLVSAAALVFLPVLAVCGPAAHAADPGFCRPYAHAALKQVRDGLADSRCGGALRGARWSSDFAVHYEWCLGASTSAVDAEREARTRQMRACSGR